MPYRTEISPAAGRDLRRLPKPIRDRLEPFILALADEPRPHGVRKVRGTEATYRIRAGDYRIAYDIDDRQQLVVVLHVGRRTETRYRRL